MRETYIEVHGEEHDGECECAERNFASRGLSSLYEHSATVRDEGHELSKAFMDVIMSYLDPELGSVFEYNTVLREMRDLRVVLELNFSVNDELTTADI